MDWWKKSIIHDRRTFPQTIFIKIKASALSRSRSYWGSFHSSMKLCRAHNFCASPLKEVECNYFLKSFSSQSLFPQAGIVVFVGREMKKVSSAQQQQKLLASSLLIFLTTFLLLTIVFFFCEVNVRVRNDHCMGAKISAAFAFCEIIADNSVSRLSRPMCRE